MKLLYLNQRFQRANVSVRSGKATFLDDNNLRLFDVYGYWKELTAKHVVIATGSRPRFGIDRNPGGKGTTTFARLG
jgi:pyruvate/2-oxoglutarate dehydrogenase complex dihydrolipoamide dehydrogenase (E3) component